MKKEDKEINADLYQLIDDGLKCIEEGQTRPFEDVMKEIEQKIKENNL